jgi:hypothetical protein
MSSRSPNPIEAGPRAVASVEPGADALCFNKPEPYRLRRSFAASNNRKKGKKHKCGAILIVFRRNPGAV